jgi:HlyD family secretion protein
MAKQLFRKAALQRISSPEQLDQLITITTPAGWLALLAIGGFLVAAMFWSIYGSIPTHVQGSGIILRREGMISVQVQHPGEITTLNIEVGEMVEQGQIIARLQQDELLERIRMAQLELKNLKTLFEEEKKTEEETNRIKLRELTQREENQYLRIKSLESQLHTLNELKRHQQEKKAAHEKLAQEGSATESKVLEAEHELVEIQQQIDAMQLRVGEAKHQLHTIDLEVKQIENTRVINELRYSQHVEKARLEIRTLQNTFAENSQIVSPDRGRVLEIPLKQGDLVRTGMTILLMERVTAESGLEVVAYFSPSTGKQLKKGMKAQVSPSTVKQEKYGFLKGTVADVDRYPSTFTDIMNTLQNESLARMLAADIAPIKVKVRLIADADTPSGYTWSSRKGPPLEIDSGTLSFVTVIVEEQPPIALVVPILRKILLGVGNTS